jgi:hypothetical protein
MSFSHWILFADVESVIKVIAFLIFFVIPFISQIMGGEGGKKKENPGVPKDRPPKPDFRRELEKPKPKGLDLPEENRGRLVKERMEMPEGQRKPVFEAMPGNRNPAFPQRTDGKASAKEAAKQIKKKPKPRSLGQSVGDLAQQHLDPKVMREHATSLGRDIDQADERVEAHLREVFDHNLGGFAADRGEPVTGSTSRVGEGTDAATSLGSEQQRVEAIDQAAALRSGLLNLLKTPQGLKQALLLNEILGPPKGLQDSD